MFRPSPSPNLRALDVAIDETIAHAGRAPFYARYPTLTSKRRSSSLTGRKHLLELPFLDKEEAARVQEELVVDGVRADFASFEAGIVSSATTRSGRPLRILRSPDERDPSPDTRSPTDDDDTGANIDGRPLARTLEIYSPRHGHRAGSDPARVLLPATLHPNTVDVVIDLLTPRKLSVSTRKTARGNASSTRTTAHVHSRVAPITTLVCPVSTLKWLTVALVERAIDVTAFGIEEIGTTGYPLTAHARSWMTAVWGAPVFDNYSLSEIPGHAWECESCGFHHWDGASCVFELIDPIARAPTKKTIGELVITTLVPSVLRMPLLRYRTGDIVERGPTCPLIGTQGIRFRGRLAHSLVDNNSNSAQYLVLSRDILEVGEALPDIAMHPHTSETLGRIPPSDIGVPKLVVDVVSRTLRAELRYDPDRYPARAATVAVMLRERCIHKSAKDVKISLLRPGSLDVSRMALKL